MFSLGLYGATTIIVFFAQLQAKAGIGAWPMGISGVITLFIALLAFLKRADVSISNIDYLFLILALASLPFWYLTSNPLWAVVLLTLVELLGFGPTIRKAYYLPHEENRLFFLLFMLRNIFTLLALEHYSLTTVLFPVSVNISCLFLIIMISYRRKFIL